MPTPAPRSDLAWIPARLLRALAREMQHRQVRYGLETTCIGGGSGLPAVFERVG